MERVFHYVGPYDYYVGRDEFQKTSRWKVLHSFSQQQRRNNIDNHRTRLLHTSHNDVPAVLESDTQA